MNISYDATVDALYVKFIPGRHELETREIDEDIYVDFDESDRLVGIEILDASRRVDLRHMFPVVVSKGSIPSRESLDTATSGP